MDRLDRILALVRTHVPNLKIVHKHEVWWMRALGVTMSPLVPEFQSRFTTVVGDTVYLPCPIELFPRESLAGTLAHELVHQIDQKQHGLWFYASYGLAYPARRSYRAHWERRAYAVDLMLAQERGGDAELNRIFEVLVQIFSGRSYLWMCLGEQTARDYLSETLEEIRSGALQQRAPYCDILAAWCVPDVDGEAAT